MIAIAPFGLPFGAFFVPVGGSCKFLSFTLAPSLCWWYIITVKRGSTRQAPNEQKGSEMFDYSTIKQQILDYVGEFERDYDLDEVMDEIRVIEPDVQSIDDVDLDDILQRHDVSGK